MPALRPTVEPTVSRRQQSGAHRDVHVPWRVALTCRLFGHAEPLEHLTSGWVLCTRCTRIARTPVELP